jgi:hypothetical protein
MSQSPLHNVGMATCETLIYPILLNVIAVVEKNLDFFSNRLILKKRCTRMSQAHPDQRLQKKH